MTRTTRRLLAGFAALATVAGLAAAPPALAQSPAPAAVEVPEELQALAAAQDTVEVIVEAAERFDYPQFPDLRRLMLTAPNGDQQPSRVLVGSIPSDLLDELAAAPGVVAVEHDRDLRPAQDPDDLGVADGANNDQVNVADLHPNHKGAGRVIAILDTGVDKTHQAIAGRVVGEACFDDDGTCPGGTFSASGPGTAVPCTGSTDCGHGTAVASIAAGGEFDQAVGAAPQAGIYAIRIGNQQARFSAADIVAGLQHVRAIAPSYAAAGTPIVVANMSIGGSTPGGECTGPTANEIAAVRNAGILPVVAAGNGGSTNGVDFPGCALHAFTVASVVGGASKSDAIAGYSNMGGMVDVMAPGTAVVARPGGTYGTGSGTSFAAPVVAGTAAVLDQIHPNAPISVLEAAMRKSGPIVEDTRGFGWGRFRLDALVAYTRLNEYGASQSDRVNPITPARVLDTRDGMLGNDDDFGPFPVGQATEWTVPITGPLGLDALSVEGVSLNLTVANPGADGWVDVRPAGTPYGGTSMVNVKDAPDDIAQHVTSALGAGGAITIRAETGTTHLVVDVAAWHGVNSDTTFVSPARIDDRNYAPNSEVIIDPRGKGGVPTNSVQSVILNVGQVAFAGGYNSVVPSDQSASSVSLQQFNGPFHEVIAAHVVVRLGPDGRIKVRNATSGDARIFLDVVGYVPVGAGSGADITALAVPQRIHDSRNTGLHGAQSFVDVNVPIAARAVIVNLTAIHPQGNTFASVLPTVPPSGFAGVVTSNLNAQAGDVLANLVTVPVVSGKIRVATWQPAHYLVDLFAYVP